MDLFSIASVIHCYFREICARLCQLFGLVGWSRFFIKVSENVDVNLRFVVMMDVSMRVGVVMVYVVMDLADAALLCRVAGAYSVLIAVGLLSAAMIAIKLLIIRHRPALPHLVDKLASTPTALVARLLSRIARWVPS